jgi:cytochrome c biogenesis protein CcmG, thiol:disulfide interchange protein DsbE
VSAKSFTVVMSLLVAALLGLLVYGVAGSKDDRSLDAAVARGEPTPVPGRTLERPDLDGAGTRSLADFAGKPVLLNFWASWCEPCKAEAPLLKAAQRRLEARGGTVLGATYQDVTGDSRAFERAEGLTFPSVRDLGTELAEGFGTNGLPETFAIDAQGNVVDLFRGQLTEPVLERLLRKVGA